MKIEQRKYRDMLREAKIDTVSNLVLECSRDMKKLYKVINGITSNNPAKPMPETMDDKTNGRRILLEFLIGKIKKICEALGMSSNL